MTTPPPPDDGPRTIAGAVARGGALALRDMLLNAGVLFSLIVGVGGAVSGAQPWVWLGPVIGVVGVVASFAGHRARVVTHADGTRTTVTTWPSALIWVVAIAVPLVAVAVMAAMWG